MSVPSHLWLYDNKNALIKGGSGIVVRESSIETQSFIYCVPVPANGNMTYSDEWNSNIIARGDL